MEGVPKDPDTPLSFEERKAPRMEELLEQILDELRALNYNTGVLMQWWRNR